jgi:PAS domain S-box-containing protein
MRRMEPAAQLNSPPAHAPLPDFRAVFDAVPGLYLILLADDPTYTIVAVNRAYAEATMTNADDIVGRGLFEVFPDNPADVDASGEKNLRASLRQVLATKTPHTMPAQRYPIRKPEHSGGGFEERYWSPVNTPLLGADGQVQFIIHRVQDVTQLLRPASQLNARAEELEAQLFLRARQLAESERLIREQRETEQKLRALEARFLLAFAQAPIGMVLLTPDGTITDVNQAYLDALGYTREELNSRDSSSFTHPDDIELTRDLFASLQKGPKNTGSIEKRYFRKDGQMIWNKATTTLRRDHLGRPIEVIAIVEDITQRKLAEERLSRSQAQLRAIYDGAYEYICLLSTDGTLLDCNRASLEFAGNRREDIIGLPFWETPWFVPTPGASQAVREGVALAATGQFVRYEAPLIHPSGAVVTFDFSLHPVLDDRENVIYLLAEGRNITERKEAELRDAFLVGLDDATRPLTGAQEIIQTAARLLGEHLRVNRCAYADVEPDQNTFNLIGDYTQGVPSMVGRYTLEQFGQEFLRLSREGKVYVVEDVQTDPRAADALDSYRLLQVRSAVCAPLLKAGRLVAGLAVLQTTPRKWRQNEIELVQLVAGRCWESIERVHVARELKEREQRYRFLAESIPQMVWTATPAGDLDYLSGQGTAYFGVPQGTLPGPLWLEWIHPDDRELNIKTWTQSVESGQPYETTFRLRRAADSSWRWHLARALPLTGPAGAVTQWFGTCTDIEDQKQADAKLHQQWQAFDTALSNTPDFTYTFDLSGRFTYINRALLSLLQKSLEEACGKNFFDLEYPPSLAARLQLQIQQVIDTLQPVRDQTEFTGPAGESRFYEYIFVPVLDSAGRIRAVAGSTRDITEQNLAAQRIEDDRRRWRDLLEKTPAGIALLRGPQHTFEWVNPDYERIVGRTAASLIGKTVREAFPEVDGQVYFSLLHGVYQTGEPFVGRESPIHLNRGHGTPNDLYINFVYLPTRDLDGNIDGIYVHFTDVTGMVVARKQVEESERQFRTLAETIPHLAWMAGETGDVFWYNRRWYDYTGLPFNEIKGWAWQQLLDPKMLSDVLAGWRQGIASGEPFEMIFPLRRSDGEFRSFLTRVEPVKDIQGRVVRWFGTNTDITDQRKIQEELRRMNRELEEFAYVASHDLQEPLRMVNIYTQMILRNPNRPQEELNQYSGFVHEGVKRMEALIQDLLSFSRSVHTEDLPVGAADLSAALNEAKDVLKGRIQDTGATIQNSTLPTVRGDTAQLAHVFQNVLSNALKYRKKDALPEISISAKPEGDQWIISVRDNGIGFEPQYAERIFGLFKRLHKEEFPGTGLGLAICRRIVERYGGRIWAEGKLGEGAVFYISLPTVAGS